MDSWYGSSWSYSHGDHCYLYFLKSPVISKVSRCASHLELWQLWQTSQYLLCDQVHSSVLRSQVELPLQPGIRSWNDSIINRLVLKMIRTLCTYGETGAGVITGARHDTRLSESRGGRPRPVLWWRPKIIMCGRFDYLKILTSLFDFWQFSISNKTPMI